LILQVRERLLAKRRQSQPAYVERNEEIMPGLLWRRASAKLANSVSGQRQSPTTGER
jgi:hypothetical protein